MQRLRIRSNADLTGNDIENLGENIPSLLGIIPEAARDTNKLLCLSDLDNAYELIRSLSEEVKALRELLSGGTAVIVDANDQLDIAVLPIILS